MRQNPVDEDGRPFEPTRLECAIAYRTRDRRRFEIARAIGISTRQLDRFEKGDAVPTLAQISRFSVELNFPYKFFFGPPLADIEWNSIDFGPWRFKANQN